MTVYAVCLIRNRCRSEAIKLGMEVHYRNNTEERNAQNYICLLLITFENVHCRILANLKFMTMRQFCLTSIHIIAYNTDRLHLRYFKFQNYLAKAKPNEYESPHHLKMFQARSYHVLVAVIFFLGATSSSGSGSAHYRGFTITFRHTILGRTPLDE